MLVNEIVPGFPQKQPVNKAKACTVVKRTVPSFKYMKRYTNCSLSDVSIPVYGTGLLGVKQDF